MYPLKILHLTEFFTQPAVVMVVTNMKCGYRFLVMFGWCGIYGIFDQDNRSVGLCWALGGIVKWDPLYSDNDQELKIVMSVSHSCNDFKSPSCWVLSE